VSNNSIDSGISLVLQSAVSACATLQVYKPFSALHCSITPPAPPPHPPQHLSLSDNKVGHVAAAALARGISSSRFISRLELARCSIGDKGARVMQLLAPRSLSLMPLPLQVLFDCISSFRVPLEFASPSLTSLFPYTHSPTNSYCTV
jgi:hypothetical protein